MPFLHAERLGHAWLDAAPVFSDTTFTLPPGWAGLVGPNGAGKSTLLALLAGHPPRWGRVRADPADLQVGVAAQAGHLSREAVTTLLVAAGLLDGPAPDAAPDAPRLGARELRRLLGLLRLDAAPLARWPSVSPGEHQRWRLAVVLASAPDVLLLDEPTNHLDREARTWLAAALADFRGIGVLVAHDRALLDAVCARTLWVEAGEVRLYPGGYSAARALREAELDGRRAHHAAVVEAERQAHARVVEARRVGAAADRRRSAGARMKDRHDHDATSMGAQLRADWAAARLGKVTEAARRRHDEAVAARERSAWPTTLGAPVFVGYRPPPSPTLATLSVAALRLPDGRPLRVEDQPPGGAGAARPAALELRVARGARLRIAGPNGAGKTTLVERLLTTAQLPEERVLYLPQDRPAGAGRADLAALRALDRAVRGRVLQIVAALGVEPSRLLATPDPSPGEARKLAIALGLGRDVWVAVLDEPTNHLDLPSTERLEAALAAWPGTLVLVSHDDTFAAALTHETWTVGAPDVAG